MDKKEETYRRLRIAGFATFIPLVLISGPIGGYLIGDFIREKFHLASHAVLIGLAIGSIASFMETIRIIRAMLKSDKGA